MVHGVTKSRTKLTSSFNTFLFEALRQLKQPWQWCLGLPVRESWCPAVPSLFARLAPIVGVMT